MKNNCSPNQNGLSDSTFPIKIQSLESLEFSIGAYDSWHYKIRLEHDFVCWSCHENGVPTPSINGEQTLSPSKIEQLISELNALVVIDWSEDYPSDTYDGTTWSLSLHYNQGQFKTSTGHDDWPTPEHPHYQEPIKDTFWTFFQNLLKSPKEKRLNLDDSKKYSFKHFLNLLRDISGDNHFLLGY